MAGYRVGDNFRDAAVIGVRRQFDDRARASCGMIHALAALQSSLKLLRIFAKIMQKPRKRRRSLRAKFLAASGRLSADAIQMASERLPVGFVPVR